MEVLARARALRRLRSVVLGGLILLIVAGVGLWAVGRFGSFGDAPPDGAASSSSTPSLPTSQFEVTVSEGERPLFRVRAAGADTADGGMTELRQVELTLYAEDGREATVAAEQARYDPERREGTLRGNVVVRGEGGLELRAEELALTGAGRFLTSEGAVSFSWASQHLEGRADRLRFDFRRETFGLAGAVEMHRIGDPRGFALEAGRVLFEKSPQRLIRAEIGVKLTSRDGWLSARRMAIYLATDRDAVEYVRARWQIAGDLTMHDQQSGEPRRILVEALGLSLLMEPATRQPKKLELEGSWAERTRLRIESPSGEQSSVLARFIQGDFAAGRLVELTGLGLVELTDGLIGLERPHRLACAARVTAQLDSSGSIARVSLEENVDLHQPGLQASGAKAESYADGSATLTGSPALLLTERGELRAPTVQVRAGSEIVEATGGVDARFPRRGMGWIGDEVDPRAPGWVQVRAPRAVWQRGGESWSFEGGVRAWSGSDVMTADQMRGDADRTLLAAGSVETVAKLVRSTGPPTPLRVRSKTFEYRPDTRRALYRGDVVAIEEGREIRSDELEVTLGADGRAERIGFRGSVHLVEKASGRTVDAARGEYDPSRELITFDGSPVVLEDGQGGRLAGARVEYSTSNGQVKVLAGGTPGG